MTHSFLAADRPWPKEPRRKNADTPAPRFSFRGAAFRYVYWQEIPRESYYKTDRNGNRTYTGPVYRIFHLAGTKEIYYKKNNEYNGWFMPYAVIDEDMQDAYETFVEEPLTGEEAAYLKRNGYHKV